MAPLDHLAHPLDPDHPLVDWVRREVLPLLVERFTPSRVIVFDPPDRPAGVENHPPGLLVVSPQFTGMKVQERNAIVQGALAAASPVRLLCLTPAEFTTISRVPGPVLAAARLGVVLL